MDAPLIEVDWTVDPTTRRSNSSPEFRHLVAKVAEIIRNAAYSLINGQIEAVSRVIVAQLAHKEGLAPQKVAVQSVESNPEGVLCGIFVWNGIAYSYKAEPIIS